MKLLAQKRTINSVKTRQTYNGKENKEESFMSFSIVKNTVCEFLISGDI